MNLGQYWVQNVIASFMSAQNSTLHLRATVSSKTFGDTIVDLNINEQQRRETLSHNDKKLCSQVLRKAMGPTLICHGSKLKSQWCTPRLTLKVGAQPNSSTFFGRRGWMRVYTKCICLTVWSLPFPCPLPQLKGYSPPWNGSRLTPGTPPVSLGFDLNREYYSQIENQRTNYKTLPLRIS